MLTRETRKLFKSTKKIVKDKASGNISQIKTTDVISVYYKLVKYTF